MNTHAEFKRKQALWDHIIAHHSNKAHTYTKKQLASKMTRARFKKEYLQPAMERKKARLRIEGYVCDEDNDISEPESEDPTIPFASHSDAGLAAAVPPDEGDLVGKGQAPMDLDPNGASNRPDHQNQDDEDMESESVPSPVGQWGHARDALRVSGHSPIMQTMPPGSKAPSLPPSPLPMPGWHVTHSPQRPASLCSTPFTAAPRLVSLELPVEPSSPTDATFPGTTVPTREFTNDNALGLDFRGRGMGSNNGLPYFRAPIIPSLPTFPTEATIDQTGHYYRRVACPPTGSHGQGLFSSPPLMTGSAELSLAHPPVYATKVTLGGLSPTSWGVTGASFWEDGIII
ncbi:hypothetical protein FRC01_002478 [Tulasnella sp. 417]|nr:hypothetical protein FRC01_002478 [Tulasnella sp. 417]